MTYVAQGTPYVDQKRRTEFCGGRTEFCGGRTEFSNAVRSSADSVRRKKLRTHSVRYPLGVSLSRQFLSGSVLAQIHGLSSSLPWKMSAATDVSVVLNLRSAMKAGGIPCCSLKRGHPKRIQSLKRCRRMLQKLFPYRAEPDPSLKMMCLAEPVFMSAVLRRLPYMSCTPVSRLASPSPDKAASPLVGVVLSVVECEMSALTQDVQDLSGDSSLSSLLDSTSSSSTVTSVGPSSDDAFFEDCIAELDKWMAAVRTTTADEGET